MKSSTGEKNTDKKVGAKELSGPKYIFSQSNSFDPYFNLALEKYLFDNVHDDEVIFFLWQNEKTVVCGRNQNIYKECNVTEVNQLGGKIARRLSGGGTVFHDMGNLNFTFIAKDPLFDIEKQLSVIVKACEKFGLNAELTGRNDITIDKKKFSGNAFYSFKGSKFHHGTIMVDVNESLLSNTLNVNREKLESNGVDSVKSRVTNLASLNNDITVEKMKTALIDSFKEVYNVSAFVESLSLGGQSVLSGTGKGGWTSASSMLSLLKGVSENQKLFNSDEWIYGPKFKFTNTISKKFDWGFIEMGFEVKGDRIANAKVYSDSLFPRLMLDLERALPGIKYSCDDISSVIDKIEQSYSEGTSAEISSICSDIKNLIKASI